MAVGVINQLTKPTKMKNTNLVLLVSTALLFGSSFTVCAQKKLAYAKLNGEDTREIRTMDSVFLVEQKYYDSLYCSPYYDSVRRMQKYLAKKARWEAEATADDQIKQKYQQQLRDSNYFIFGTVAEIFLNNRIRKVYQIEHPQSDGSQNNVPLGANMDATIGYVTKNSYHTLRYGIMQNLILTNAWRITNGLYSYVSLERNTAVSNMNSIKCGFEATGRKRNKSEALYVEFQLRSNQEIRYAAEFGLRWSDFFVKANKK